MYSRKPHSQAKLSTLSLAIRNSILGIGLVHGVSNAATIEVTTQLDNPSGEIINDVAGCSVREAIESVNSGISFQTGCVNSSTDGLGTNDTVIFNNSLTDSNITLNGNRISIGPMVDLSIDASTVSGITIDANQHSGVLFSNSSTLSIDNISVTGASSQSSGIPSSAILLSSSNVTINNSSVFKNYSPFEGAGIAVKSSELTLINSTVSNNTSDFVGAGIFTSLSTVTIVNSTISKNTNTNSHFGAGVSASNTSVVTFKNSTITDNSNGYISAGTGLHATESTSINLINSIIANSDNSDCMIEVESSTLTSDGYSLIEDGSCGVTNNGDPGLQPLVDNGGNTLTHALKINSIARNAGNFTTCEVLDQRGKIRNDGDISCDIGAIEYDPDDINNLDDGFIVIPLGEGKTVVIPN